MTDGERLEQQRQGVVGAVTDLSSKIVTTLPPAFLGLCLINLVFIVAMVWYFDHQRADRVVMFNRLMDACMAQLDKR